MTNTTTDTANQKAYAPRKREWRKAWRALKQLVKTPEDTGQVFMIIRSLAKDAFWTEYLRFKKTEFGRRVLRDDIELFDTLTNRDYLQSLPQGSFGRVYFDFCTREDISPEGFVAAGGDSYDNFPAEDMYRYARRVRESHDLWHVITGYGRDGFGESCLVAFSYAQTKNLGFAAIAAMGAFHFKRKFPKAPIWTAIWQAYRIGKKTAWLPAFNWEAIMHLPLNEVQEMVNAGKPKLYEAAGEAIAGTRPEVYVAP